MTVLTDRLVNPLLRRVHLAEVTAGENLTFWTLEAGQTYTYYADLNSTPGKPIGALEDGVELSAQTSIATVESNAGSWYATGGKMYVHPVNSDSPFNHTIQGTIQFYFSNVGRIYNGVYYDPRISALPKMSLRVEPKFGAVGQIGGGELTLLNGDSFFDGFGLQWDAGSVAILMSVDPLGGEALYSEFDPVGTWKTKKWSTSDDKFVLQFAEVKQHVRKKIPLEFYTREEYANMEEESVGKPKQIAYGLILDVRPVCINLVNKTFQAAGHRINQFLNARLKDEATELWYTTAMTNQDLVNATVDIPAWDQQQGIAIDFEGKVNDAGLYLENAADVVRDLLQEYLGVTDEEIDDVTA